MALLSVALYPHGAFVGVCLLYEKRGGTRVQPYRIFNSNTLCQHCVTSKFQVCYIIISNFHHFDKRVKPSKCTNILLGQNVFCANSLTALISSMCALTRIPSIYIYTPSRRRRYRCRPKDIVSRRARILQFPPSAQRRAVLRAAYSPPPPSRRLSCLPGSAQYLLSGASTAMRSAESSGVTSVTVTEKSAADAPETNETISSLKTKDSTSAATTSIIAASSKLKRIFLFIQYNRHLPFL